MSKQIYIDSQGNKIMVSGTVNAGSALPMSGSDNTSVATKINSKADQSTTYTKTQVDALLEKTMYQHAFSGNQTLDSIQTWCKTADKGTYWFNAYLTTPYQGWVMGIITNKQAATSHTQILIVFNSAIVTSFTSTLTDTTPTWTTKSIILS